MTINEYYGFPEGTIVRLDSRLPDMLPNDIEISDIRNAYTKLSGYRILKFSKDAKYTNISQLAWLSSGILGIIDIDTEKCTDFGGSFDGVRYLPIIDISSATNTSTMVDANIRTFGIKGIYKLTASPYEGAPNSAELFRYEGKYKKYYRPIIGPLPSTARKLAFGPTDISAYIIDNLVYVTSGDVTIGGIPATYRYSGEWYITKDFIGEEKSQDLEVRYNGELLGYASPLNDGEFFIGENQPAIYEGEALNNIMASNTNWTYDSSNGYWIANSLPATMVLNASGNIKITANPNRSSHNQITVSDANGNTLGSYTASFSEIVSNPTDSITIKATGYTWDGKPTISKIIVNMPEIPDDRPLLFAWTPAVSNMYAVTPTGNKDIPSDVTYIEIGSLEYPDILGVFSTNSTSLKKFIKYNDTRTNEITDFTNAWYNCSSLTKFPLIDTSNGTTFEQAWRGCSSLTSFPLINTSKATNLDSTWRGCSSLTEFPLIDTSNVTDFSYTWHECSSLTSFPLINTSKATNFHSTWGQCAFTEFPMLDLSNGTNFNDSWVDCAKLITFPSLDLSKGTNFFGAWARCYDLVTIEKLDLSSGTDFGSAWYKCSNITNLGGFGAIKASISLYNSPNLTVESIMNVITQAADLNELGIAGKTMTLGSTNLAKLTDEQKAVATNKGWTLA